MATTKRDYYELLGVARNANDDEIKRAFRRLARQLHPDVSDDPDAEQRFREVVEAYEVLSNAERRSLYDRYGHAGLSSGGFRPSTFDLGDLSSLFSAFFGDDLFGMSGGRRARGADIAALVEIDLAEAATALSRGRSSRRVPRAAAADGSGTSRAASSASSCARRRAGRVAARAATSSIRAASATEQGGSSRSGR